MQDSAPVETLALELDLTSLAPAQAEIDECVTRCGELGVRFLRLAEVGDTPQTRLRLYELVREGVVDDPSNDGTFIEFEEFSDRLFEPYYWRWSDSQFIAATLGEWVGLTNLQLRERDVADFGVTVVKRAYRGLGIARALKLLALRHAVEVGVVTVRTRNDPRNSPILKLNRRLGFIQKLMTE